ncbi:hypothetical protein [Muricoccus radiodurans]|uniref:hypothetical protein n=1 Tax=Muricoccus radiodurans TaxID=2231721 RepID=UPI003CEBF5FF
MLLRLASLVGLAFLPACATITTSPSQNVNVVTEPAGATCTFQRNGQTVGVVNPTPGTVRIGKSSRNTTVSCTREGHLTTEAVLTPEFQPMFLGNILIGGVVGIIVDASTGAVSRYPDALQITLPPDPAAQPPAPPPVAMDPLPDRMPERPRRLGRGRVGA